MRGSPYAIAVALPPPSQVTGPNNAQHYSVTKKQRGTFEVLAPAAGEYKVCFSNKASTVADKVIAFNIHNGDGLVGLDIATKGARPAPWCAT